jgi:N-acyl homoserine lactone hydrolase
MSSIRIHPLHLGTLTRPVSNFLYGKEFGKLMDVPLIAWYIEGSDKKILVDTGGIAPEKADPGCHPYTREESQSIVNALKRFGLTCNDIEILITTHLHWDHCSNNHLFPKAHIFLQKEELESARNPFPIFARSCMESMITDINYTLLSGDAEIAKGVKVVLTPGHTCGHQGVLVEAETQRIVIAGDTIPLFRTLAQDPPLISATYVDLRQYYASFKKLAALSALILPGHDFKVFEKEVYC